MPRQSNSPPGSAWLASICRCAGNCVRNHVRCFFTSARVFLTMAGIPLSASIADGLALGFVSYPVVKLLSGRGRDVHLVAYVMAALLVVYFLAVRYRLD